MGEDKARLPAWLTLVIWVWIIGVVAVAYRFDAHISGHTSRAERLMPDQLATWIGWRAAIITLAGLTLAALAARRRRWEVAAAITTGLVLFGGVLAWVRWGK